GVWRSGQAERFPGATEVVWPSVRTGPPPASPGEWSASGQEERSRLAGALTTPPGQRCGRRELTCAAASGTTTPSPRRGTGGIRGPGGGPGGRPPAPGFLGGGGGVQVTWFPGNPRQI